MPREISAGIIIYRQTADGMKFLLTYHGGRNWNFPKGKLDGESNFKAALREVREETGLAESDLRFRHHFKVQDRFVFTRAGERIFKVVTYYLAETKQSAITLPVKSEGEKGEPHDGYGWFVYRDALRMLIAPNLKRNLKRAYAALRPKEASSAPRGVKHERKGGERGAQKPRA
jgi:8-oxo-dGTP pyrophosphatase MutT (NUDIX family)